MPTGSSKILTAPNGEENSSFSILNPNDGIVYATLNAGASLSTWDWKLPSQSYGIFPGPWQSVGLFYLDQSGAGRNGEITLYTSNDKLNIPDIRSIGRALQAQQQTLDITYQTNPPTAPATGLTRLWAADTGRLHELFSNGTDYYFIDTGTALGGDLTGNLPAPTHAPASIFQYLGGSSISGNPWNNTALSAGDNGISGGSATLTVPDGIYDIWVNIWFSAWFSSPISNRCSWAIRRNGAVIWYGPPTNFTAGQQGFVSWSACQPIVRGYGPGAGSQTWDIVLHSESAIANGAYLRNSSYPAFEGGVFQLYKGPRS
jgi:hypothetical protein